MPTLRTAIAADSRRKLEPKNFGGLLVTFFAVIRHHS